MVEGPFCVSGKLPEKRWGMSDACAPRAESPLREGGGLLFLASGKLKLPRHSDQFCQGVSLHLVHHVTAMDLHGDFTGPKVISDLLIEHARNYQSHDLALACGQRRVAVSQLAKLTLLLARHTVAVQSLVDRIQQVLVREGLGKELHRTGFHGLHRHRNISMTGDKDDRNPDARI